MASEQDSALHMRLDFLRLASAGLLASLSACDRDGERRGVGKIETAQQAESLHLRGQNVVSFPSGKRFVEAGRYRLTGIRGRARYVVPVAAGEHRELASIECVYQDTLAPLFRQQYDRVRLVEVDTVACVQIKAYGRRVGPPPAQRSQIDTAFLPRR